MAPGPQGEPPADRGAPIVASTDSATDGREVGFVGSPARHDEPGPITLALNKRDVPLDADLIADGMLVAQEVIVDPAVDLHVCSLR